MLFGKHLLLFGKHFNISKQNYSTEYPLNVFKLLSFDRVAVGSERSLITLSHYVIRATKSADLNYRNRSDPKGNILDSYVSSGSTSECKRWPNSNRQFD